MPGPGKAVHARHVIHVAGPVCDEVQSCDRCGRLLVDYRDHFQSPIDGGGRARFKAPGTHLAISCLGEVTVTEAEPTC